MTVLEAVAILEAAVLECKKREVNTPELRAALDFLEPHIQPAWLIPQFRDNLDGEQEHDYGTREGQQQVLRATFPRIQSPVRELVGRKMDALVREFHDSHNMKVKDEIERLAKEYGRLGEEWVLCRVELGVGDPRQFSPRGLLLSIRPDGTNHGRSLLC